MDCGLSASADSSGGGGSAAASASACRLPRPFLIFCSSCHSTTPTARKRRNTGFGVGRLPVCRTPSISQPLSPLSPLSPVGNMRTFAPSSTNVIAC
eukprot:scaffold90882_cov48-Phaeocystis_antarctica.AAC.2